MIAPNHSPTSPWFGIALTITAPATRARLRCCS